MVRITAGILTRQGCADCRLSTPTVVYIYASKRRANLINGNVLSENGRMLKAN